MEGASVYGGLAGYENTAELITLTDGTQKVILNRQDGTASAGWLVHVNGTPIGPNTLLLTRKEYSDGSPTSYGITRAIGSDTITDATYNYYLNGAIVEPKNRSINYKVVNPLEGSIEFIIETNESVKTGDGDTPTEEPETPVTPTEPVTPDEGESTETPTEGESTTDTPESESDESGSTENPEEGGSESTTTEENTEETPNV